MTDPRHRLGLDAEDAAAHWLAGAGWRILARRWRVPEGELDIVALDTGGTLVAVEVRARSSPRAGTALESVDGRRVRRLRRALSRYAGELAPTHAGTRLDLVTMRVVQTEAGPRWAAARLAGIDAW